MTRLVDPDLGRALSGGYRLGSRPRVYDGPPDPATNPPLTTARAAVVRLLRTSAPLTVAEMRTQLGFNPWPALMSLAHLGRVEGAPIVPGCTQPYVWRLRRRPWEVSR